MFMESIQRLLQAAGLIVISASFFLLLSLIQLHKSLRMIVERVQEDITFSQGKWDTSAYNADPQLPGTAPLYILGVDGYVIERWKFINGFLDTSDFKHLMAFSEIQTIQTVTNQNWRVVSLPIQAENAVVGVVTVSSFMPSTENLQAIDEELVAAADTIKKQIVFENNQISVNEFDERRIPYDISYQVVDRFHKIVFKSNNSNSIDRLPNFIDPSYVSDQLNSRFPKVVKDVKTNEYFLLVSQPLYIEENRVGGVIVAGRTIHPLLSVLVYYLMGMAILVMVGFATIRIRKRILDSRQKLDALNQIPAILFDKLNSQLIIGDTSVAIVFASNQYYFCDAIFSNKKRRWEVDELIEKFGDQQDTKGWRKVYDTMNLINKKVKPFLHRKLILLEGKTYRYNPDLLEN